MPRPDAAATPFVADARLLRRELAGRRILVSGAAGSIGSAVCARLASLQPDRIVALDLAEAGLQRLVDRLPPERLRIALGNVRDGARLEALFREHRPDVVLHAAAHKHVPLLESAPCEAIKNNVGGTRTLRTAAVRHAVDRFVLISSDKAVRPAGVMGATKRISEWLALSASADPQVFRVARFGNVLESSGSVSRMFREQLAVGARLRVTDPRATRYFMTADEAADLVLAAACEATCGTGRLFTLDFPPATPVIELARRMLREAGRGEDEIDVCGLRPGEKLHEQLFDDGESALIRSDSRLRRVRHPTPPEDTESFAEQLLAAAEHELADEVRAALATRFPTLGRSATRELDAV